MRPHEKTRPALTTRKPGEYWKPSPSYSRLSDLQDAGLRHTEQVRDLEERFLSAVWHGLPDSYDGVVDAGITTPDVLAHPWHRELFRVLMAFGWTGQAEPSVGDVLTVLRSSFPASLITHADQLVPIFWAELGPSGLVSYARLIVAAHRRRLQFRRLWRALHDRLDDPFGEGRRKPTPVTSRRVYPKRRASAGRFASCR